MPGDILNADIGFPHFTGGETTEEKIGQISNYLYMLLEQLRYNFGNIGPENMTESSIWELTKIIEKPLMLQVKDLLTITVDDGQGGTSKIVLDGPMIQTLVHEESEDAATSAITQTARDIRLAVTNNDQQESKLQMTFAGTTIESPVINLSGYVTFSNLTDGTTQINGGNITTGTITSTQIASNAITSDKINAGAVTANKLAAMTITADKIKLGGWMEVYQSTSSNAAGGYLGYSTGFDGQQGTAGIGMKATVAQGATGTGQVKATSSGASIKFTGDTYGEVWTSAGGIGLRISDSYDPSTIYFDTDDGFAFRPASNNSLQLGSPNHHWGNTYCNNGAWTASDRNIKNSINYEIDDYLAVFDRLRPVSYKFDDGTSNRTHIGFIAQDVEQAIIDSGMTTQDYACIAKYLKEDETYGYSLRYEEFIALNTLKIKKLEERIAALEAQIGGE